MDAHFSCAVAECGRAVFVWFTDVGAPTMVREDASDVAQPLYSTVGWELGWRRRAAGG